jgi:hypothetical protein
MVRADYVAREKRTKRRRPEPLRLVRGLRNKATRGTKKPGRTRRAALGLSRKQWYGEVRLKGTKEEDDM